MASGSQNTLGNCGEAESGHAAASSSQALNVTWNSKGRQTVPEGPGEQECD